MQSGMTHGPKKKRTQGSLAQCVCSLLLLLLLLLSLLSLLLHASSALRAARRFLQS